MQRLCLERSRIGRVRHERTGRPSVFLAYAHREPRDVGRTLLARLAVARPSAALPMIPSSWPRVFHGNRTSTLLSEAGCWFRSSGGASQGCFPAAPACFGGLRVAQRAASHRARCWACQRGGQCARWTDALPGFSHLASVEQVERRARATLLDSIRGSWRCGYKCMNGKGKL